MHCHAAARAFVEPLHQQTARAETSAPTRACDQLADTAKDLAQSKSASPAEQERPRFHAARRANVAGGAGRWGLRRSSSRSAWSDPGVLRMCA